jgi:hypothetical protein
MRKKVKSSGPVGERAKKIKCCFCDGYLDERGKCDNPFCRNYQR